MHPPAPLIKTFRLAGLFTPPRFARAIVPAVGTAAACSNVTFLGLSATESCETAANSAYAPPFSHPNFADSPKTSSPALNRMTFLPADSTIPERSVPGIRCVGLLMPFPMNRKTNGYPTITCHTSGCIDAARTRTRTSSSFGMGFFTSWTERTTSGAPYAR